MNENVSVVESILSAEENDQEVIISLNNDITTPESNNDICDEIKNSNAIPRPMLSVWPNVLLSGGNVILLQFDTMDSTQIYVESHLSDILKKHLLSERDVLCCTTREQVAGIGSADVTNGTRKIWKGQKDDVFVTLIVLMSPESLKENIDIMTSVAAGCIGMVIEKEFKLKGGSLKFKSLNDLYFENKKFAGCLASLAKGSSCPIFDIKKKMFTSEEASAADLMFNNSVGQSDKSDFRIPCLIGYGINISRRHDMNQNIAGINCTAVEDVVNGTGDKNFETETTRKTLLRATITTLSDLFQNVSNKNKTENILSMDDVLKWNSDNKKID